MSALHYELFVPDQKERWAEVTKFFSKDPGVDRAGIIDKYNVRWIVLNRKMPRIDGHEMDEATEAENEAIFKMLYRPAAVVDQVGDLVLMDARKWVEAGATTQPGAR